MSKYWKYLKYIVIPLGVLLIVYCLYNFIDGISDGVVGDWFYRNYMESYEVTNNDGTKTIVNSINWEVLKTFVLFTILNGLLVVTVIFILVLDFSKRRIRRVYAHQLSGYLNKYILEGEALPAEVEKGSEEVFLKLSEIKNFEQHKESLLRLETSRKDDLVTYLAHDLRTPLTSVIGYLTVLDEAPDIPVEMRQQYTDIAIKKANRMEQLITEMLDITRYNITKVELEMQKVYLSTMLEQITYEFKPLMKPKNLTFDLSIHPHIYLTCDVDKMERIIDNLIRNAIHYSYENSLISLYLNVEEENVVFRIKNASKTIPEEKLNRIFEQFYKVDSSRNSSNGGSGLGLSIAKQLVEAHGGIITAHSENETITFEVKIPLSNKIS